MRSSSTSIVSIVFSVAILAQSSVVWYPPPLGGDTDDTLSDTNPGSAA
jgi:hypothetical protein